LKKLDEVKDPEKKLSLKMTFYRNFVVFDHRYRDYFIRLGMGDSETVRDATRDAEYETFELLKNCAHIQPELLDHMSKILGIFIKNYNCFYMATKGAKIKEGSNLSGRNVATYRMAVALGIEDCVARSETAKVRRNDKLVYGNLMEEAKGSEALKMGKQKDKKYTSKCVCDIAMMQVFDLICGQIDRNGRNYYVNATAENIDSIKMIDNDLAFGNLSADELMNGYQSMPKFMDALILALPDHFKRRVLEMDKKTISLMLEDILTTEEIEAASKRLDIVKAKIRLIQNGLDDKKKSEKSEDRFEEYCLGFEEYRALNYQLSILDAFKTENERFRKKERKTKPVLERYTYLRQNNMLSEKEIIDRMKKFKEKHKKDKWDGR
ncbi:MAG: hypothetical protein J6X66_06805, partial [Lachnospiraceae bacterium]|nr:hypothetical protein [Lachnospiraceae bacterium]